MADIENFINSIVEQVKETEEEFIFETIRPYCEDVIQRKIDKNFLSSAVLNFRGMNLNNRFNKCPRCNCETHMHPRYLQGRSEYYCWNCGVRIFIRW